MESSTKLQVVSVGLMGAVLVALLMDIASHDRLEEQVIATRLAVEGKSSIGSAPATVAVQTVAATDCAPGQPSGRKAKGWGGREADILCVEGSASGAPRAIAEKPRPQGDSYVNRRTSPPSTLNYYATSEGETGQVTKYILEKMIEIDPDAPPAVLPSLATSWEVSADHLTYTYHLRRGVQFADGRPFTAEDVVFTFDVVRDPAVKADHLRPAFEDVKSLVAKDPYTVEVTYAKTYWKGIYAVGNQLRVLNKAWVQEQLPKVAKTLDVAVVSVDPGKPGFGEVFNKLRVPGPGTGPYYFSVDEYDPKKPLEITQNPFYWGTQVNPTWYNLTNLRWIFISDEVAAFEAFRKQSFDVSVVDFQPWDDQYKADPTITGISNYFEYDHMGLGYSEIVWNNRQPPFNDPKVRLAMTHLVDRGWIIQEIERGRGEIATCPSKKTYPQYLQTEPIPFDVEKARALLAEAGWKDTNGDGVLDKGGKPFEFELKVGSPRRFYTQVAAQLGDAAKKVGIRMTLRQLEWATFIQDYQERRFDSAVLYESFSDPWIDSYESFHSSQDVPNGGNAAGWHNPAADTLLEGMRTEFDNAARDKMYQEFCRVFIEDQPVTLLAHGRVGVLQNGRFEGAKVRPTGLQLFDIYVKPDKVLYK
jgi:peptide/nickel transport system substrate-binding protein